MQQYFSEDNLSNVFRNKSPAAVAGGAVEYFIQGLKAGILWIVGDTEGKNEFKKNAAESVL